MNELAGKHGFGRIDMIENRLIGVKSREIYEVPGALTLITAHKALEDLCLEREVLHYKLGIEQKWAELVYNGMWFSPLKEALDGFVETTQQLVTGDVRLRFFKGSCVTVGRRSPYSLYDYNLATYDAADTLRPQGREGLHRPARPARRRSGRASAARSARKARSSPWTASGRSRTASSSSGSCSCSVAALLFGVPVVDVPSSATDAAPRQADDRLERAGSRRHGSRARRRRPARMS